MSQIQRLVAEAQRARSHFQALADRAAFGLTLIALGAGTVTLIVWLLLGFTPDFAITRLVAVMVIACPHAWGRLNGAAYRIGRPEWAGEQGLALTASLMR